MKREHQTIKENAPKVPGYIVTYSDMVTLLLTFFVMLLTLANVQDPELFNKGRDSFLQSIRDLGVGVLFGGYTRPHFGHVKVKYFVSRPDYMFEDRCIDANEEDLRRIFRQINRSVKTMPSQIVAKKTNFSIADIRFPPGGAGLDEPGRRFLSDFCLDLQQEPDSKSVKLYVLGLAGDAITEKAQYTLSARRAQAVADFLKDTLGPHWPVYSWGAGPGGEWVRQESPISEQSQILIAVLRSDE